MWSRRGRGSAPSPVLARSAESIEDLVSPKAHQRACSVRPFVTRARPAAAPGESVRTGCSEVVISAPTRSARVCRTRSIDRTREPWSVRLRTGPIATGGSNWWPLSWREPMAAGRIRASVRSASALLARNPGFGPVLVRVLPALLNGPGESSDEATSAHAGAGREEVAGGLQVARGGQGDPRGGEGAGGLGGDLPSLACAVRRDEGRRCEALEGARARERDVEADRCEQGGGDRGAAGDREGTDGSQALVGRFSFR